VPEAVVHRLSIHPLLIPLRNKVVDAAAERGVADPVVVSVELTNGLCGHGETVPRPSVTGETVDSVIQDLRATFMESVMGFHLRSFPEALEAIESLPWQSTQKRPVLAARAAIELALLDASMRTFRRSLNDAVQWMGLPAFGSPGSLPQIRFCGVLAGGTHDATLAQLRQMYWYGLRRFTLKVGFPEDLERLKLVLAYLRRPLTAGRAVLRLDANSGWSPDDAASRLAQIRGLPIAAIEQPLPRGREDALPQLRKDSEIPIVHDESLLTLEDARRLVELGPADGFSIGISKCGGLLPSLRLAAFARRRGIGVHLGCMLAETGILSAAGLRFLEVCPAVTWAEGCYGRFLLRADIASPSLRFRYGGRSPRPMGSGLGVELDAAKLEAHAERPPIAIQL